MLIYRIEHKKSLLGPLHHYERPKRHYVSHYMFFSEKLDPTYEFGYNTALKILDYPLKTKFGFLTVTQLLNYIRSDKEFVFSSLIDENFVCGIYAVRQQFVKIGRSHVIFASDFAYRLKCKSLEKLNYE